jgi:uncharacterized damage-inducible protein DinB
VTGLAPLKKESAMPTWRDHFRCLARYNVWATDKLLEQHIKPLSEDEYRRDVGLFFKSVHGTLNHLLVGEHGLWYVRFAEGVSPKRALNEDVETERASVAQRLREASRRWEPLIASWDEARFDGNFDYLTTKGVPQSLPFTATLAHVFNHGTHHRGQITAAITAMGRACPEIDLVWMLQAEKRPA